MADKPVLTKQQRAAFNTALKSGIQQNNLDMIDLALGKGADPDILLPAGIERRNMEMITRALDKGASVATLLFEGIHFAPKMKEYFAYAARSVTTDAQLPTPKHFGLDFVETAVRYGADVNAKENDENGTPYAAIHWAYANFNEAVSDFLIEKGAVVDTPTANGNTPLMRAVLDGDAKLVTYYLGKGADPLCPCGKKKNDFPLQALERSDKFGKGKKAKLLQAMMEHVKAIPAEAPAAEPKAPEAAPGSDALVLQADLEVSKPAVLQQTAPPPKAGKSFSL